MVRYRRNFVAGATYFLTVTLADRTSSALVDHIDVLRAAVRATRQMRPFIIDAIVVLYVRQGLMPEDWGGDVRQISGDFGEPKERSRISLPLNPGYRRR